MSGSSLDGVDLACCEFVRQGRKWESRILAAETLPYPTRLKIKLSEACHWSRDEIRDLDLELGEHFAGLLNDFHSRYGLHSGLIGSHGHTILHEPHKGITLQVGNGEIMARETGIRVVNDFRSEDVAQGGQGAPLVPVGDRLLFGAYEGCLNLGGFSNISFEDADKQRRAYDIGPANMALNWIAGLNGLDYDKDGELARTGSVSADLLHKLNHLEYYGQDPPKSLGKEWFARVFLPCLSEAEISARDLMATTTEHIAIQLARGIQKAGIKTLLLTGGGALNHFLIERLKHHTKVQIVLPDSTVIQYKEALIFAFLGLLKMLGQINCLASVTGGQRDLSTGSVHTCFMKT